MTISKDAKVYSFSFQKDGKTVFSYRGRVGTEESVKKFAHTCIKNTPWDEFYLVLETYGEKSRCE